MATTMNILPPEILEQILSHLPMLDILQAQSVCLRWCGFVPDSPTLQRKLFFEPCSKSPTIRVLADATLQHVESNSLLGMCSRLVTRQVGSRT